MKPNTSVVDILEFCVGVNHDRANITKQEAIDILLSKKESLDADLAVAKLAGLRLVHTERLSQAYTMAIDILRRGYKNECEGCLLENDCPGYYDGCFDAVNGDRK